LVSANIASCSYACSAPAGPPRASKIRFASIINAVVRQSRSSADLQFFATKAVENTVVSSKALQSSSQSNGTLLTPCASRPLNAAAQSNRGDEQQANAYGV
jgi:hypothetical protein